VGDSLIDLRVMRDRWMEDGAREVFAQLVTMCVRSNYAGARAIRPNPGDEGVDTFVGDFDHHVKVWQAKYFCDGVGESQQKQIRDSFKACMNSSFASKVKLWTLCVPCDLSIDEEKWWQGWRTKMSRQFSLAIDLWTKTHFVGFSRQKDLERVFAFALLREGTFQSAKDVIGAMINALPRRLERLPAAEAFSTAVFVRKLEAAGITQHRAARSAFYNFELLRKAIEEGGTAQEQESLSDLQERVYDLWEAAYNARYPDNLGRALYSAVESQMREQDGGQLASPLNLHLVHKKGGLHYWADICEAGWTVDFKNVVAADEEDEREDPR
jgi:hypothetical protein